VCILNDRLTVTVHHSSSCDLNIIIIIIIIIIRLVASQRHTRRTIKLE